jgi:hypothetical protein
LTVDKVLDERGTRYGPATEQFPLAQNIKSAMRSHPKWDELPYVVRETLEMIATKISRIITGDPLYDDNWIDIAGYAQIVVRDAEDIRMFWLRIAKGLYDKAQVKSDV